MPCKFSMIFMEYLRILGIENTAGGGQAPGHEGGGRALPLGRAPCFVGSLWPSSTYSCTHTLLLPPTNTIIQLKHEFQIILLRFSISLLKAPFTKLLWEIVLWYVTPPMAQLIFVLVLYSLQIFAAQVTMFLSLYVKFMWFQVVLMHDIGSRHLQEQLLSILLSLVHFYLKLLKISEIFQRKKYVQENVPRWFLNKERTQACYA